MTTQIATGSLAGVLSVCLALVLTACQDKADKPGSTAAEAPRVSAATQKYEGKIVRQPPANRGKDDGWYLVQNGKRRWIVDGAWLARNGRNPSSVIEISSEEFAAIPEDRSPLQ